MGRSSEDSYFFAEFSHPFAAFGAFKPIPPNSDNPSATLVGTRDVEPASRTMDGNYAGVYLNFSTEKGESTLWLVPQDVAGLANLLGGRENFAAKLDEFFSTPYTAKDICRDCSGMVGEYAPGNQPGQQTAYYFAWPVSPGRRKGVCAGYSPRCMAATALDLRFREWMIRAQPLPGM